MTLPSPPPIPHGPKHTQYVMVHAHSAPPPPLTHTSWQVCLMLNLAVCAHTVVCALILNNAEVCSAQQQLRHNPAVALSPLYCICVQEAGLLGCPEPDQCRKLPLSLCFVGGVPFGVGLCFKDLRKFGIMAYSCPTVCQLPKEVGPCLAIIPRWWFNEKTSQCEQFNYGGCGGNGNNFETLEACQKRCPGVEQGPSANPPLTLLWGSRGFAYGEGVDRAPENCGVGGFGKRAQLTGLWRHFVLSIGKWSFFVSTRYMANVDFF